MRFKADIHSFKTNDQGVVAAEFALIFPLMFIMILGIWDLGNGLWVGQKVIKSTHIVADLMARELNVSDDEFDQAIEAGRVALLPFDNESYAVQIVSVSYDEDGAATVEWQEAVNTTVSDTLIDSLDTLGGTGGGALAVRVTYQYEPTFSGFIIGTITMSETAYVRGRKAGIVNRISS